MHMHLLLSDYFSYRPHRFSSPGLGELYWFRVYVSGTVIRKFTTKNMKTDWCTHRQEPSAGRTPQYERRASYVMPS